MMSGKKGLVYMTWHDEVLKRIEKRYAPGQRFTIHDVYGWEEELKKIYPNNRNIAATFRDVVQELRDEGYVVSEDGEGGYRRPKGIENELISDEKADYSPKPPPLDVDGVEGQRKVSEENRSA